MYYPATFTPYADGSGHYGVTFVDLPGCVSIGENLEDAMRMGAEALSLHIGAMLGDGEKPPAPSTIEEAERKDRREAELENACLAEGTLHRLINFEPALEASERLIMRVTISLKPDVLNMIDKMARELGMTRSGFITAAAREYSARAREKCHV